MSRPHHFTEGRPIKTASAVERAIRLGDWFYWGGALRGRPKHPAVIGGMPFIYICDVARRGLLFRANPTPFRHQLLSAQRKKAGA